MGIEDKLKRLSGLEAKESHRKENNENNTKIDREKVKLNLFVDCFMIDYYIEHVYFS